MTGWGPVDIEVHGWFRSKNSDPNESEGTPNDRLQERLPSPAKDFKAAAAEWCRPRRGEFWDFSFWEMFFLDENARVSFGC